MAPNKLYPTHFQVGFLAPFLHLTWFYVELCSAILLILQKYFKLFVLHVLLSYTDFEPNNLSRESEHTIHHHRFWV
jgi:hypothetical protein